MLNNKKNQQALKQLPSLLEKTTHYQNLRANNNHRELLKFLTDGSIEAVQPYYKPLEIITQYLTSEKLSNIYLNILLPETLWPMTEHIDCSFIHLAQGIDRLVLFNELKEHRYTHNNVFIYKIIGTVPQDPKQTGTLKTIIDKLIELKDFVNEDTYLQVIEIINEKKSEESKKIDKILELLKDEHSIKLRHNITTILTKSQSNNDENQNNTYKVNFITACVMEIKANEFIASLCSGGQDFYTKKALFQNFITQIFDKASSNAEQNTNTVNEELRKEILLEFIKKLKTANNNIFTDNIKNSINNKYNFINIFCEQLPEKIIITEKGPSDASQDEQNDKMKAFYYKQIIEFKIRSAYRIFDDSISTKQEKIHIINLKKLARDTFKHFDFGARLLLDILGLIILTALIRFAFNCLINIFLTIPLIRNIPNLKDAKCTSFLFSTERTRAEQNFLQELEKPINKNIFSRLEVK